MASSHVAQSRVSAKQMFRLHVSVHTLFASLAQESAAPGDELPSESLDALCLGVGSKSQLDGASRRRNDVCWLSCFRRFAPRM